MLARDSLAIRGAAASLIFLGIAGPAFAYRPFDGTDAAVAAPGELEVELQPAGVRRDGATPTLVAPWTVLNFGLSEGWEAVFEGQGETPLSPSGPTNLIAAGAFLKHVVLPGSLQGKSGPSIATEFGVLLPDSTGDSGVGASWAGIISQRWDWGTINLNVETVLTRDHHADVFLGSIIEGPAKWTVRPVAELFYEREFGQEETFSGLVGLIWQVSDKLAFDVAYRHALTNHHPVNEIRAGLTFGFPLRFFESAHAR
jgi:hypothetical protein